MDGRAYPDMAFITRTPTVDVYSLGEVARAAGVSAARVEALVVSNQLRPIPGTAAFFAPEDAVAAVRLLRADAGRSAAMLFDKPEFAHTSAKLPVAAASAVHAGLAATLVLISMIGIPPAAESERLRLEPVQNAPRLRRVARSRRWRRWRRVAPESSAAARTAKGQVVARQSGSDSQSAKTD